MTDRHLIDDVPRSLQGPTSRAPLTADQIEQLLDNDQSMEPAMRRHLEEKLGNMRHREAQRARDSELSAREIVDRIPRHFA